MALAFLTADVEKNKKFELMLTRHAKAYHSFCSQTVSLFSAISSQFIANIRKLLWNF